MRNYRETREHGEGGRPKNECCHIGTFYTIGGGAITLFTTKYLINSLNNVDVDASKSYDCFCDFVINITLKRANSSEKCADLASLPQD